MRLDYFSEILSLLPLYCEFSREGKLLVKLNFKDVTEIAFFKDNDKLQFAEKHNLKLSLYFDVDTLKNCRIDVLKWFFERPTIANVAHIAFDPINAENVDHTKEMLCAIHSMQDSLKSLSSIHIKEIAQGCSIGISELTGVQFISCDQLLGFLDVSSFKNLTSLQFKTYNGEEGLTCLDIKELTFINSFNSVKGSTLILTCLTKLKALTAKSTGPLSFKEDFDALEIIDLFEIPGTEPASLTIGNDASFPSLKTLHIRSACEIELNQQVDPFPVLEVIAYPPEMEYNPAIIHIKAKIEARKALS